MKKHLSLFVGVILYITFSCIESPKLHASNKVLYLDSLEYDSLDSIYLRESDYVRTYLLDETGFFGDYHYTITSEKADSILTARKRILRNKKNK